jgi:hypothetical protein
VLADLAAGSESVVLEEFDRRERIPRRRIEGSDLYEMIGSFRACSHLAHIEQDSSRRSHEWHLPSP